MAEIVIAHAQIETQATVNRLLGRQRTRPLRPGTTQQGKLLCDTLLDNLPGGTVDALLYHLLQRKASIYRVPAYRTEAAK